MNEAALLADCAVWQQPVPAKLLARRYGVELEDVYLLLVRLEARGLVRVARAPYGGAKLARKTWELGRAAA